MAVKVGINGFGRIGRVICRTCLQNNDIELSAINDPAITAEYICYLIKFDSTHGKLNKSVTYSSDEIAVEDHIIKVFHEKLPSTVPWQNAGVQYVIEASGMFTNLDKASGHMQSGSIKRVIVTAPSVDVPMIILGVNDFRLRPEQKVLSCGSSTLYCLAPIIKVLEDHYGIAEGFVTSIHAMTPSLKPLDGLCLRGKHWRDHRSIHQNIIPATTGACKALAKIIPQVKDKLSGLAFRVPIVNVSVLDITIRLNRNTSLQDIIKNIEKASNTTLKNILKISNEETVSSDYIGESHSCIFDAESSLQLKSNFYKLICWYENEHSYACRVIDSIFYSERQLSLIGISSKMTNMRAKPSQKYDVVQQTDCLSKEISVEFKYSTEFLCSTSQDTSIKTKEPIRVAILKKPLSAHISGIATSSTSGREMKRRNEIFKIWNDNNEISKSFVRQNRGSFFHSCISFTPKDVQRVTTKATECSESRRIKQDISKVEFITDDLLMKTQNIKNEVDTLVNSSVDNVNSANKSKEEPTRDYVAKSHKFVNSLRTFDVCGDCDTRIKVNDNRVLDGCSKEELIRMYDSYNKDFSEHNVAARRLSSMQDCDKLFSKLKPQSQISPIQEETRNLKSGFQKFQAIEDDTKILVDNNAFKERVAKAINTLIEGLEQSFQAACKSDNDENSEINNKQSETCSENCIICCHMDKNDSKNQCNDLEKSFDNSETDISNDINNEVTQLDSQPETKSNLHLKEIYIKNLSNRNSKTNNQLIETNNKEDKYFIKQVSTRLNRYAPEPVITISEDRTRSPSPENRSCCVKKPKPDIYDKLDSRSGTDSENSFEVNSRTSQVIHITDLTKSLEDLTNLDKICRIIEISDELSDKLFSALSTSDSEKLREKKWSFKDLCERIKLDDFCNKVFGKTAL